MKSHPLNVTALSLAALCAAALLLAPDAQAQARKDGSAVLGIVL
jgi:hypothetical protein